MNDLIKTATTFLLNEATPAPSKTVKFIYGKEIKGKQQDKLTLIDVKNNQFFVSREGYLCQKMDDMSYITITDKQGRPSCDYVEGPDDMPIARLLSHEVKKIEY